LFLRDPDGMLSEYYVDRGEARELDRHDRVLPIPYLV
jgi:hypothetical protein